MTSSSINSSLISSSRDGGVSLTGYTAKLFCSGITGNTRDAVLIQGNRSAAEEVGAGLDTKKLIWMQDFGELL
jgi:hypothetical protein